MNLIEYKIEVSGNLETIKTIYEKFLKDDPIWHFAFEDKYILLRVISDSDYSELDKYFNNCKWKYTKQRYVNSTKITREYQEYFDYIYHGYAMLAVTLPEIKSREYFGFYDSDVFMALERIVHLACNNLYYLGIGNEFDVVWKILNWRHKTNLLLCSKCCRAINSRLRFKDTLTWKAIQTELNKELKHEKIKNKPMFAKFLLLTGLKDRIKRNYFLDVRPSKRAIIRLIDKEIKGLHNHDRSCGNKKIV